MIEEATTYSEVTIVIDNVAWRVPKAAAEYVAKLEAVLARYADYDNWGYYDKGCPKGHGEYLDACFIGPGPAMEACDT